MVLGSMESEYIDTVSSSSEDDEEAYSVTSDEPNSDDEMLENDYTAKNRNSPDTVSQFGQTHTGPNNIVQKLLNRERFGSIRGYCHYTHHPEKYIYTRVPNRMHYCLKDILPARLASGHVFMGLTACGQFLLSYKIIPKENVPIDYSFNSGFHYTLYFWIFQPHQPISKFYKCCLFDDHGVDNMKEVTITQWKNTDPRLLVVHGTSYDEGEHSYVTYVKVPKLGCLDCKNLKEGDPFGSFPWTQLCLKCNLTVHTKYTYVKADRRFDPYINLICPNRILLVSNGLMHMLKIEIETNNKTTAQNIGQTANGFMQYTNLASPNPIFLALRSPQQTLTNSFDRRQSQLSSSTDDISQNDNFNNIVARIQADFSDIETASTTSNDSRYNDFNKNQNNAPANVAASSSCSISATTEKVNSTENNFTSRALLISPRHKHKQRIVTKSFRNGVITVDMQGLPSTSTGIGGNQNDKSSAYDFSEDNEKCEKIAILRKRRLADKKYEFSEDNSENIVPFTKVRSANRSHRGTYFGSSTNSHATRALHRGASNTHTFQKSPCASPSSSPHTSFESPRHHTSTTIPAAQCVSPVTTNIPQGFRSPQSCGSPISVTSFMRSPKTPASVGQIHNQKSPPTSTSSLSLSSPAQQMLSFKPLGALSPLQVSMTKNNQQDLSSMSPNAHVVEISTQPGVAEEKPLCTKKLQRRYVEEDDAASVITSEEDDCISPGYHTSLPLEVHGSWYSEMHMVSQASYQQLRCPSVVVTQHTFDFETFTYYVISMLCQKNQKTYDVFYDWAYEVISVCPVSNTVFCVLLSQFSAHDQLPATQTKCYNCARKLDCGFHRRNYESRILFTWQMETAEWDVLDYGELRECNTDLFTIIKRSSQKHPTLAQQAKIIVQEMSAGLDKIIPHYSDNLRVLDSNIKKSKRKLTDMDNLIELHLSRPRNTVSLFD